ncbi:MAG: gamma-glutamylcyclotransferase family protein [Chloroflexota bacterium]
MGQYPFFVYGTLLPGQPNDHFWENKIEANKPAHLSGVELFAFPSFPMMVISDDHGKQVFGQLIWTEPDAYNRIMKRIDILENYDSADPENSPYQRELRDVYLQSGETIKAWTYLGQPQLVVGLPQILSGDWLDHVERSISFSTNQIWWRNRSTDQLF